MKALPEPPQPNKVNEEPELDRGRLLLAEEILRSGKAGDPDTPAFIRRRLGSSIEIEEPSSPDPESWVPAPHLTEPFLRSKRAPDGTNRYELVFPPQNNLILLRWGRMWRTLERTRSRIASFIERKTLTHGPVIGASARQLPASR